MKFFPTQLETYRNCPLKYYYSRDPEIRARFAKSTPHQVLGNAVHDALQVFLDIAKVRIDERTYERLCDLLRDAWAGKGHFRRNFFKQKEAREQAFAGDRATEKAWGEKGLHLLWRFVQTRPQDLQIVPLTAEQFHEVWLTEHVTLGGKIDRIDRRQDGTLEILDYKTGKPPAFGRSEQSLAQEDLQLAAYALLVTKKFRGRVARCSYLYLNDDLPVGYTPTDELLAAKEVEIRELCERILADWDRLQTPEPPPAQEVFRPSPNALCPWCEYRSLCPSGTEWERTHGGAAATPAEELPF